MLYARRISHKGLKLLFAKGDRSKVRPDWVDKVERILAAMSIAGAPEELDIPGFDFHGLKGNRKETYSVTVSGNYRVTFKWDSQGPFEVNLEDYHGR